MSTEKETDQVKRLIEGDEEAFKLLFFKYQTKLYAFSLKILASKEEAEEIVQEVFLKIWKSRHLLDVEKSFQAFLFTIARNHIYNQLSKKVSESTYKNHKATTYESKNSTAETTDYQELNNIVLSRVGEMPEKRKKVFLMSRYEGHSNKEIASTMQISLSTVENHLNKALKTLKNHLQIYGINAS